MTNREKLNQMTDEELSSFFCDAMEEIAAIIGASVWSCDICPVGDLCRHRNGPKGFNAWLSQEAEEDA
jgi:hypothetical protein